MARFSTVFGCLLVIAVTAWTEIDAQTSWTYNNKKYYFEDPSILLNVADAEQWCSSMGKMTLVGFENTQEWNAITNHQDTNGILGRFWTSGVYISGTKYWEWGVGTGNLVHVNDPRWNPSEPSAQFLGSSENIMYTVPGRPFPSELYTEDNTSQYMVVCEEI